MKEQIPLEKEIVKDILQTFKRAGLLAWKTHGSAYSTSGWPDIIVISRSGRFVGLEAKRPKIGRLTELQASTLNKINGAGGFGYVVHSAEEAMQAIRIADCGAPCDYKYHGGRA